MIDIATAIQILNLLPPLTFGTPAAPPARPEGSGTLLITGCRSGTPINSAGVQATAGEDGTARLTLPAQIETDDAYLVTTADGETRIHGTLRAGELLSGICP